MNQEKADAIKAELGPDLDAAVKLLRLVNVQPRSDEELAKLTGMHLLEVARLMAKARRAGLVLP